jgi:hypothetical protein
MKSISAIKRKDRFNHVINATHFPSPESAAKNMYQDMHIKASFLKRTLGTTDYIP